MPDSKRRLSIFFLIHYFVQGAIGIAFEPLNYILKDRLRLTPGQASGFFAWMTFPLLLKPLYGLVSDFLPIGHYRRKPHMILSGLLASIAFFSLAIQPHYNYLSLLIPMAGSCLFMAFAEAVCGGLLVEDGKERQLTGPYQAIHIGALYLSAILVGAGGGWLTTYLPFQWIFALSGILPLVLVAAVFFIHESRSKGLRKRSQMPFWSLIRTKSFWALSLTIVLWNFYPFLGTVQFYYQSNVLHLNPQMIGSLMSLGSIMGLIGSGVFWKFCRGRDVNSWVSWGPVGMAIVSLSYLFYIGPASVCVVEGVYGFASVFFRVALLDLIARACPAEAEASSYALYLGFFDIAMYASNAVGGRVYDVLQTLLAAHVYHDQMSAMVLILIGAACTLTCRWTLKFSRTATA